MLADKILKHHGDELGTILLLLDVLEGNNCEFQKLIKWIDEGKLNLVKDRLTALGEMNHELAEGFHLQIDRDLTHALSE